MKASRNKTIDISIEEGQAYLARCLTIEQLERKLAAPAAASLAPTDELACPHRSSAEQAPSGTSDDNEAATSDSGMLAAPAAASLAPADELACSHESCAEQALSGTSDDNEAATSETSMLASSSPIISVLDKTIVGDSFDVLAKLPEKSVDLLIVDPPYNLDKDFSGNKFKRISDEAYAEYTERWMALARPLLKDNATIYVCCDWQSSPVIGMVMQKYFHIQNRITWQREKGRGAKSNWKNGMEDIWFGTVSKDYVFNVEDVKVRRKVIAPYRVDGKPKDWEETEDGNFRNTYPSNFWDDISIPYWSMPENTAHPTQKPEKLLAKLILASSNPGDVVLDPFVGSGSTSVTAKKLGRHYIGIEQNPQYCVWAEKRLEMADEDNSIQGYTDGVFWERNTGAIQKRNKRK